MGTIYKRGKYWRIKYQDQYGGWIYESPQGRTNKWTKKADAERRLRIREAEVAQGQFSGLSIEKTTFDQLAKLLIDDYTINKKKSIDRAERSVKALRQYFGGNARALDIPPRIPDFKISRQQKAGLENASINRELAALRRMFRLGFNHKPRLVGEVPYIEMLNEDNVRTGFFEHDFYLKLKAELPPYLQIAFMISYLSGMRKEEILSLLRTSVDFSTGAIRLRSLDTKNSQPRGFFVAGAYYEELLAWELMTREKYPDCKYLIHRNGKRIRDFREAWDTALLRCGLLIQYKCKDCGQRTERKKDVAREDMICEHCGKSKLRRDDKLFHDNRRTGVRNLINSGVPEKMAMHISGHKTRSMLDRYNIISEKELKDASNKVMDYLLKQEKELKDRP